MALYHTVEQGESLISIADEYDFAAWETIWDHPFNADLREERNDPQMLFPGDEVFVPEKPAFALRTGQENKFKLKAKSECFFSVFLTDQEDTPFARCKFELVIDESEPVRGKTTRLGQIAQPVAPDATRAYIKLWPDDEDDEEVLEWTVRIGFLDPLDEYNISGVQARLNNLGFDAGPATGAMDETTAAAIIAFRESIGKSDPSAQIDKSLIAALEKYDAQ